MPQHSGATLVAEIGNVTTRVTLIDLVDGEMRLIGLEAAGEHQGKKQGKDAQEEPKTGAWRRSGLEIHDQWVESWATMREPSHRMREQLDLSG